MDILLEIHKEEMEVQNLIRDWHVQKLESFIQDLINKDRAEQLKLHDVSNLAKFCLKIAKQEDCPPEFIEIVNKEFWNLI